ncbi:MAG: hypothetical protein R3352_07940 [Salinisphaeraceae bacterium]|nr:hypothetical protein [Salinisphaeraceae bacterium]
MTREQRAQGHEGTGYGSRSRSIRLALMLATVAIVLFVGSFFFLTR